MNTKQAYMVYGGGLIGLVAVFNFMAQGLSSYSPKSTHSREWGALTEKYMVAQDMNPLTMGYTPSYLKKPAH